jgi:hypothetical protein
MKSRVARGRTQLERILDGETTGEQANAFRWGLLQGREERDGRRPDAHAH